MTRQLLLVFIGLAMAGAVNARPYPALSGISAAARSANVAGNNPAAMTRFDSRNMRVELLGFFSDNTWEGQMGGAPVTSQAIPGIGSVNGRFSERGTIFLEVAMSLGTGPASR